VSSTADKIRAAVESLVLGNSEKQRQELERQAEEARKEAKQ
jgi:hypothetical protein